MIWAGNSRTLSSGDGKEVPAVLRVGVPVGFTVAHTRDAQIPALRAASCRRKDGLGQPSPQFSVHPLNTAQPGALLQLPCVIKLFLGS